MGPRRENVGRGWNTFARRQACSASHPVPDEPSVYRVKVVVIREPYPLEVFNAEACLGGAQGIVDVVGNACVGAVAPQRKAERIVVECVVFDCRAADVGGVKAVAAISVAQVVSGRQPAA